MITHHAGPRGPRIHKSAIARATRRRFRKTTALCLAASLGLAATLVAQGGGSRDEEFARRQYESGLTFLQNKKYTEALKDFQVVIDSFPKSSVADDALMQIAMYQLDVAHNIAAAQAANEKLLKEYPDADSAPMGYVMAGRLTMAKGRTSSDVDTALASFERVPRLFPGSEAVAAAGFYAGDTLRLARRNDEALDRFRRVTMEFPRSIWAVRAALAQTACLVQAERPTRAFDDLQRVRQQFPNTPEAATAMNYNTILYRLYVRPPAQPPYAFSGKYVGSETAKYKDVVGVQFDETGHLLLGYKQGIAIFDGKAAVVKTVAAEEPSAFFIDERGRIVIARRDTLIPEGGAAQIISVPASASGKVHQAEEIPSAVALANGDRLIADRKGKTVIRFSSAGNFISNFASVNAERLAMDRLEDIAMIDRDSKSVVIVDRDGKALGKIPQKGTGYEFDNPVDLTFDPLGHLYVLDRSRASIYVFGPKNRLIATVTVPEKEPGAFTKAEAFALDGAGRIYVFDDRSQRIQVYQ
jgi:TolA-binding protein